MPRWRRRPPAQDPTAAARAAPGAALRVALLGDSYDAAALAAVLPAGWLIEPAAAATRPAVVLLMTHRAGDVAAAARRFPQVPILAVLAGSADVAEVVAVIESGADGCLRGGTPQEIAAHLVAVHRRHLLDSSNDVAC